MATKCSSCGHENEGWAPVARLSEMAEQKRAALAEAEAAKTQATTFQAAAEAAKAEAATGLSGLQTQLQSWESRASTWQTERAALQAGITDDEGLAVVSTLWSTVPEDQRPEGGITAWLSSEAAPKAVRAYLPQEAAKVVATTTGTETTGTETTQVKPLPKSNTGAVHTSTTNSQYDASAISRMSLEEYREHRQSILANKG